MSALHNRFQTPSRIKRQTQTYFQTLSERSHSAARKINHYANASGYTKFATATGHSLTLYARRELHGSDEMGSMVSGYSKAQRYRWLAAEVTTTPVMNKVKRNASMQRYIDSKVNLLGQNPTTNQVFTTRLSAQREFKKMIHSKAARTAFLEENHIFDFSSKKIQEELLTLRKLERKGQLTTAQAKRLADLRGGKTASQAIARFKTLTQKKKRGLISAAEQVELDNLTGTMEVLGMEHRRDLRRVFRSVYYMSEEMMQKSDDAGMHGILQITNFSTNRYTRATVKASMRFSKLTVRTSGKVLKKSTNLYLQHTKSGRAIHHAGVATKNATKQVTQRLTRKPVTAIQKRIHSMTSSRVGRALNKSFNFMRAPFKGRVSDAISRVTNAITKPFQMVSNFRALTSKIMGKIALLAGGIVMFMVLWILIIDIIGAVFTVIMEDSDADGKINLAPYTEALDERREVFVGKLDDYGDGDYDHVEYDLTTEENTKEIFSMMAVRFEQDMSNKHTEEEIKEHRCNNFDDSGKHAKCLGHRDAAISYIESLYDRSHVLSVSESLPYDCGKTENCSRRVTHTETVVDEEGNETTVTTYSCPGTHVNATVSSSVLHYDELFLLDGGGSYGNLGASALQTGETIQIPDSLGRIHTYMGWHTVTNKSSKQYKLKTDAGEKYDLEGFARIGDRYVIACTSTYGEVGDYVDFYQKDGSVLKCIIGDIKNQNDDGCNKWGHQEGKCIIEFVVDGKTWYHNGRGSHANPGTSACHPEWNQYLTKATNRGSYWGNESGAGADKENSTSDKDTDKESTKASDLQMLVANNARNGISSTPATLNYCAAWVSGVYEASGLGYPGGNAIDFWTNWSASGSASMDNIPIGAVVVGSGSGSMGALYGHVGIYIGNNQVAENIGRVNICSLDEWASKQVQTCHGYKGFIGWVWPQGKSLGTGTDGSFGTAGYTSFSYWDNFHKSWAKNIAEENWENIYSGYEDVELEW